MTEAIRVMPTMGDRIGPRFQFCFRCHRTECQCIVWMHCGCQYQGEPGWGIFRFCDAHSGRDYNQNSWLAEVVKEADRLRARNARLEDVNRTLRKVRYVEEQDRIRKPVLTYYAQCGSKIKIGKSVDPVRRVKALNGGVLGADHVILLATESADVERQRHEQFKHLRLSGEWFQAAPELLAHIEGLAV